jgi:dethiobiotin synthetase
MTKGYFITGTDTGVGKTLIACALLKALAARGLKAAGMKPVAAGAVRTARGLVNDDVEALRAASSATVAHTLANPYCFEPAIAPHLAARLAGIVIDVDRIVRAYTELTRRADAIVVEGVGGFCVPLGPDADTAGLAQRLGLPVVLVVGMRLGCLNHALLTIRAISAYGLELAGWVANRIDPAMSAIDENVAALAERIDAPLMADVPYVPTPSVDAIAPLLKLIAAR